MSNCDVYITSHSATYSEFGLAQSKLWEPGTLCIVNAGENTGETGILTFRACFPDSIIAFTADAEKSDVRFVNYALRLQKARWRNVTKGATQDNLSVDKLLSFPLRVPALSVQRRIADILSAYDDLVENNTKRIRILEAMARSLYLEWFVNFRFPGHEKVKMVRSRLGKLPDGWDVAELGALVDDRRDAVDPAELLPDTPYFGLEHLPRRSLALGDWGRAADVQSTKLRVETGDIVFGKIRPYFHKVGPSPVEAVCSSDAIVLRVREPRHYGVVLAVVSSDEFVSHATQTSQGTKMPRANWDVLRRYLVPVPPHPLLKRFNAMVTEAVRLIHALMFRNRNLSQTRDLLLPRLISGEIYVDAVEDRSPQRSVGKRCRVSARVAVESVS